MQSDFKMSMLGELSFFLGLQISQSNKGTFISQMKCIKEILKKFKMEDCKLISTTMITWCKLHKDDESMEEDKKLYKSMIGNLLYVKKSRLDVMQEVRIVARFQSAPKESHVQEVKRNFRYMKSTLDYGLWYPKGEDFTLKA